MTMRISLQNVINAYVFVWMRLTGIRNMAQPIINLSTNTNNQGKLQIFNLVLYGLKFSYCYVKYNHLYN